MTDSTVRLASRRQALRLLGAPFLPLGGSALLAACGSPGIAPGATPRHCVSATFDGMAAPGLDNPAAMATTSVGATLTLAFDDRSTTTYKLAYQMLKEICHYSKNFRSCLSSKNCLRVGKILA